MSSSFVPLSAVEAGLPPRFVYWSGRSGRRYLFTCIDRDWLEDCRDALVLEAQGDHILQAGEATEFRPSARGGCEPATLFVHLLARSAEERRAIVEDLLAPEDRDNVLRFAA